MPYRLTPNGNLTQTETFTKVWFEAPVNSHTQMRDFETFLINPRLAQYIKMLEDIVGEDLPELPNLNYKDEQH